MRTRTGPPARPTPGPDPPPTPGRDLCFREKKITSFPPEQTSPLPRRAAARPRQAPRLARGLRLLGGSVWRDAGVVNCGDPRHPADGTQRILE
jgi:hypothetical protein